MNELESKSFEINDSQKSNWLEFEADRQKKQKWLRYSSNIARRILAAIRDKKDNNEEMSQKLLAEKIGVSPQQINKVIKGQENLTLETIAKLSEALDVELISFPIYKYSINNSKKEEGLVYETLFLNDQGKFQFTIMHSTKTTGTVVTLQSPATYKVG